jgi:hypothetical protein
MVVHLVTLAADAVNHLDEALQRVSLGQRLRRARRRLGFGAPDLDVISPG